MKMVKRLIFFVIALIAYVILREMLNFYLMARSVNPYLGYFVLTILLAVLFYYVIIPLFRISRVSGDPGPVRKRKQELALMEMRIQRAQKNPYLKEIGFEFPTLGGVRERYELIHDQLAIRADEIRSKYIVHLFYSSAVSQYGFIDAILIFSANLNVVKEIFTLYTGRATGRDLWQIMKQIYYAIAIGGSEGVEFAAEEVISKLGSDTLNSIPFLERVMASVADGFANAVLLSRISYITENYCRMTYIKTTSDLFPDTSAVLKSTRSIVDEPVGYIEKQLKDIKEKGRTEITKYAINPTRKVIERAIEKFSPQREGSQDEKRSIRRSIAIGVNPLKFLTSRLGNRKSKNPS